MGVKHVIVTYIILGIWLPSPSYFDLRTYYAKMIKNPTRDTWYCNARLVSHIQDKQQHWHLAGQDFQASNSRIVDLRIVY